MKFVISVNGKTLCSPGIDADGALSVHVMYLSHHLMSAGMGPTINIQAIVRDDKTVRNWKPQSVNIGDRICIEIAEDDGFDPPESINSFGDGDFTVTVPSPH